MPKRAAAARDMLLKHGTVTTAELNDLGYDHPPRAIADLKDVGVTVTKRMIQVNGRRMAQYSLVDTIGSTERNRKNLPKKFREALYLQYDYRCAICGGHYTARELQVDHRIPFRISGDPDVPAPENFMPLCGSDNRAKSWTCEHCTNGLVKDPDMCSDCYWASPDEYTHIAGQEERRLIMAIQGREVAIFDRINEAAEADGLSPGDWVQQRLSRLIDD
jgi:hypothetical protein